jgi:uncharacterized Zn finger protein (UPF0148 family)
MTTSLLAKVCEVCGEVPAEAGSPYCAECEDVLRVEADDQERLQEAREHRDEV